MATNNTNKQNLKTAEAHIGTRPMIVHVDSNGNEWLCDKNVDSGANFAEQGCWRTDMMAFNRND